MVKPIVGEGIFTPRGIPGGIGERGFAGFVRMSGWRGKSEARLLGEKLWSRSSLKKIKRSRSGDLFDE